MAIQLYSETFSSGGKRGYDSKEDIRKRALVEVNEFLLKNESIGVVNIVEHWNPEENYLHLTVYFKEYF